MKNLFLLPTNKPSRLYDDGLELYLLIKASNSNNDLISYKNIYITIDEEIKEGDWSIELETNRISKSDFRKDILKNYIAKHYKKIILTTDQSLDGVQAIDDEFLEWFIKNPSCEEVEIKPLLSNNGRALFGYKIIIPKEEPKYSVKKEYVDDQDAYGYDVIVKEKSKQETLEEAAERVYTTELVMDVDISGDLQSAFIAGAKWQQEQYKIDTDDAYNEGFENGKHWQQERSYSEEDIENIWNEFVKEVPPINNGASSDFLVYLKQFKK